MTMLCRIRFLFLVLAIATLLSPLFAQQKMASSSAKMKLQEQSFLGNIQNWPQKYLQIFEDKLGFDLNSIQNPSLFGKVGEWLGTPYRYRGNTRRGINCSSFVSMLYSYLYDIELNGSSREMFQESVIPIPKESLQESDLIFFKIRKQGISHVGIYLGNNKFAHATLGKGVTVSDLDEDYYKKHFYAAGRVKDLLAIPLLLIHF